MGYIVIAGQRRTMPDDVRVVTFLDPDGLSFYASLDPPTSRVYQGEQRPYIFPRRLPQGASGVSGLFGQGFREAGEGDAIKALAKVVRTVVLHHDGNVSSKACFATLLERGYSTHFMIDADGTVYQATDVADMALHAGGVNQVSIGIDLNNPALNLVGSSEAQFFGRDVSDEMEINGTVFKSLKYTDAQYKALIELLRILCSELGIEPVFPVGEDGKIVPRVLVSPPPDQFCGIQCHWHSSVDKWDPGPGFDWERVQAALRAEDAQVPVVPSMLQVYLPQSAKKMWKQGAGEDENQARRAFSEAIASEATGKDFLVAFCRAQEKTAVGGFYPIGINQTWHNGIHIPVEGAQVVRPMLPGDLVAAHLVPEERFGELGSNNFVLLRHRINLPPRYEGEKNVLTVFSLYMHLAGFDIDNPTRETALVQALRMRDGGSKVAMARGAPLEVNAEVNQVQALRAGYVALFSKEKGDEPPIRLTPRDELWFVGEFGKGDKRQKVLHFEVFGDSSCLDAMELSLYGSYLTLGPDESWSKSLLVRSREIIGAISENALRRKRQYDRVLTPDEVLAFFSLAEDSETEKRRDALRKLVVRHVSEWATTVEWAKTLLEAQEGKEWVRRLGDPSRRKGIFSREIESYLSFVWLSEEVSKHIGVRFDNGVFTFFHPVYFLLWWLYRRSAVRGKSLEDLIEDLGSKVEQDSTNVWLDMVETPAKGEWRR
jgi:N-acetyl-anhydromuramyl-L-alanine amidase AmpD